MLQLEFSSSRREAALRPISPSPFAASRARGAVLRGAALLAGLVGAGAARAEWVASWASAPAALALPSLRSTTVRQSMRLSLGGAQVRVRFSNEAGSEDLAVRAAHLALPGSAPGSVDPASDRALTFGGSPSAVATPGAALLSDPVDMPVAALTRVVVTAWLDSDAPQLAGHLTGGDTAYLAPGDHTGDAALPGAATTTYRYALGAVEVSTPGQPSAVLGTLGDSITDGLTATVDADRRWTDRLAERATSRVGAAPFAVVNGGISGNGLLTGKLFGPAGPIGPSAVARLDRDALARPGLRWLILFEGINDIMFAADPSATPAKLIAAYRQIVARAHERGVRVVGGTLTPFAGAGFGFYSPVKEAARGAVNAWIRGGGELDAVVDFDAALRDPSRPLALRPAYDSGDHLHPSDAGYRAMGDAVPLDLFR